MGRITSQYAKGSRQVRQPGGARGYAGGGRTFKRLNGEDALLEMV